MSERVFPEHTGVLLDGAVVKLGTGFTVTVTVEVLEQPAEVPVTV